MAEQERFDFSYLNKVQLKMKPNLALVAFTELREQGIMEMAKEANLITVAPYDSLLHRFSSHNIPIDWMEGDEFDFQERFLGAIEKSGLKLDGIISLADFAALPVAMIAERNHLPGPPSVAIKILRNKYSFRIWLKKNISKAYQTPVSFKLVESSITKSAFFTNLEQLSEQDELILKPISGAGNFFVSLISSKQEWQIAFESIKNSDPVFGRDFMIEKKICGREVSVETIVEGGSILKMFLTAKIKEDNGLLELGHYCPVNDIPIGKKLEIFDLVFKIHKGLNLENIVTHTELILPKDGGKPAVIEINPRIGGGMIPFLHKEVSGVNLYRIAARIAVGLEIPQELLEVKNSPYSALVRFAKPCKGMLNLRQDPFDFLTGPRDRFQVLLPLNKKSKGRQINDDRPAMVFLVGVSQEELHIRSNEIIHSCISNIDKHV